MKTKQKITAIEVEKIMQEARNQNGFIEDVEQRMIVDLVENAKVTGKFGDKVLLVINPMYIHFPFWQRELRISNAQNIGDNYDCAKWELPKIYLQEGKLYCADGMHRIYGAFLSKLKTVVVELLMIDENRAMEIFLDQTVDRNKMAPADIINAAITSGKSDWIEFQRICHENGVNIKGDYNNIKNAIGTFTPILYDGVNMCAKYPEIFKAILKLLRELHWGENCYNSKVMRSLKQLMLYYGIEKVKKYLLCKCKGLEYYQANIAPRGSVAATFDFLSEIINNTKPWEFTQRARENKKISLTEALREAVAN